MREITTDSPERTAALAASIAPHLMPRDVVGLVGDLGAGKSHFARALISARLAALGLEDDIPSPSFTLVQTYDLENAELWHVDLYRLADAGEIIELGIEEAFESSIVLVEWIDRLGNDAPRRMLRIELDFDSNTESSRRIRLSALGNDWDWLDEIVDRMEGQE
ncbi:tRNA (adenosine(37)-N6)-threonylcarbamoyltransferase complex ATPase subunit type 1 TsaE [Amaricoccus macauensis]|uniref:tRNA (adenosine(37)-N6)-threonylcarbamoyltransferase complex ATPase subunit type 1 TsaE n=1 Tax=Amaricoccus macauensis TaxID=57001 RepID=UPI003C7DDA0B